MTTQEPGKEVLANPVAAAEAGFSDLLDLYMRIEDVYVAALESLDGGDLVYVSDSTNGG